ncbi:U-box domain-containing protein 34-like [Dorcoceras hygrometricum]|uniref:U-box domain-containing protein 34-like n=1 Tax=Dorcoceras hygrometricum TaxID=472368 RepID=A0A2Z7A3T9_9LAMI|nr:U-box domain-containing protein 34-like [Dorcoceras hygrometricum]
MSLFDLQDVCIAIGSLVTLDLPMIVDLIGIYGLKGPYCTLTTTNWFLQALSVIPRGSWSDVARRSYHDPMQGAREIWKLKQRLRLRSQQQFEVQPQRRNTRPKTATSRSRSSQQQPPRMSQATGNQTQAIVDLTIVDIYSQLDNQSTHTQTNPRRWYQSQHPNDVAPTYRNAVVCPQQTNEAAAGYKHATSFHLTQRIQISLKRWRLGISRYQNTLRLDFTKSTSSHHETSFYPKYQKYENFQKCSK